MTIEISQDIDVVCDECGKPLKADYISARGRIDVHPCKNCSDDSYNTGYDDGKAAREE